MNELEQYVLDNWDLVEPDTQEMLIKLGVCPNRRGATNDGKESKESGFC